MSGDPPGPTPSGSNTEGAHDQWMAERTTFQRVYDVVTGLREYTTVSDIADRAACSDDGARDALTQLAEMGIVERRGSRPVEFRRNEAYFRWKRTEELVQEHTTADLRARLDELTSEDERLQERFDAPAPAAVPPDEFEDHRAVHDRLDALARWRSVRHDIEILQAAVHRAERRTGEDTGDTVSA